MQNNLSDLNQHLFIQLENLMDDEASTRRELQKTHAVVAVAKQIVDVGRVQVAAIKVAYDCGLAKKDMPDLIEARK